MYRHCIFLPVRYALHMHDASYREVLTLHWAAGGGRAVPLVEYKADEYSALLISASTNQAVGGHPAGLTRACGGQAPPR